VRRKAEDALDRLAEDDKEESDDYLDIENAMYEDDTLALVEMGVITQRLADQHDKEIATDYEKLGAGVQKGRDLTTLAVGVGVFFVALKLIQKEPAAGG